MIFFLKPEMIYAVSGGAFTYPDEMTPNTTRIAIAINTYGKLLVINSIQFLLYAFILTSIMIVDFKACPSSCFFDIISPFYKFY